MSIVTYNERSWAIDLITDINLWLSTRSLIIKRAGGEHTLEHGKKSLFPDLLLFGDLDLGKILIGWELKMPDTSISDEEFIKNAKIKASLLSLRCFLLWNVASAVLYKIKDDGSLMIVRTWNNLAHIKTREEVVQHRQEIQRMLEEILNDTNQFLSDGTISSTSVVQALTSGEVSNLVLNNIGPYVSALKTETELDNNFQNEIALWWRYVKKDYPEEQDKYVVLARSNLLFLINKFLFAHILKAYQSSANAVDTITNETEVRDALKIFSSISEKSDFWNIFEQQKGENLVTTDTWQTILSFNNLLKEFSFAKIDRSLLHDLIGKTIAKNKRKFAGQFSTPPELAKLITLLTIKNKSLSAIDPCCGTGTIVKAIYNHKKSSLGVEKSLDSLWASDKFSLPLQMAMFNMADPEALGLLVKIFKKDATNLEVNQTIEFHEPFNGSSIIKKLPQFEYIVSNLPFVQQEDLEILNPHILDINTIIVQKLSNDFELDGKSDLYAYLPFYFWKLLASGGKVSIIISNSWLGTKWGWKFYQALAGFFKIQAVIISGSGRWFNNAQVVSTIVLLEKKDSPVLPENKNVIKFIVTKKKLISYSDETLQEIVAITDTKEFLEEDDLSVRSYSHQEINEVSELGLNLNSFFAHNGWILDLQDKIVNISKFFEIRRGERRGWDKLFYPESENTIELEYLKPVLKTPRTIDNLIAEPDALAFCCDKSKEELVKLGHFGALAWIQKFEGLVNERNIPLPTALARGGTQWYTMLPSTMAEIVTNINFGDRLFFARFSEPAFVNQRLVRFTTVNNEVDVRLCHALMNSILSLFYIEAMGTGRGQGALDLSANKFSKDFHIINPDLIPDQDKVKILSLFEKLKTRNILPITEELKQQDREAFDNAVLDAIGCLSYKEQIKKSLLTLYRIRSAVND